MKQRYGKKVDLRGRVDKRGCHPDSFVEGGGRLGLSSYPAVFCERKRGGGGSHTISRLADGNRAYISDRERREADRAFMQGPFRNRAGRADFCICLPCRNFQRKNGPIQEEESRVLKSQGEGEVVSVLTTGDLEEREGGRARVGEGSM